MKNTIIKICFLLFSVVVMAQQEINTSFATQMTTMFSPLDKTKVPHGVLLDYAMEFTNVPAFNGTLSDSTYVTPKSLKEIYNTLLMGRIHTVTAGFISPQDFENNWYAERSENNITLSGLYFKYSRFVANATTAGKLTYSNGQFYDKFVNGVWQNPYEELKTFVVASPIEVYTGLNLQVKLPQTLFYSNYANEIQKIEIDFADGLGFRQVTYNQLLNINYPVEGNKIWNYRLTLTSGQIMLSQSKIKILKGIDFTSRTQAEANTKMSANNCGYYKFGIQSSTAFAGLPGKAMIFVDDAGNDCQITKPLIVVEGWDVSTLLSPETKYTSADFENFLKTVEKGANLSTLLNGNPALLHDQQYDIIYINWDNGMDYIERNALVVEEVIKWVNSIKVGNEKAVVIGQSMGGVVARYCLRDMEQRGIDPKVRLFVSDDSPQQGANMPLSIQYLYRNIRNQVVKAPLYNFVVPMFTSTQPVEKLFSILDQPATAQMLINRVNTSYQLDNNPHDTFYNTLKTKGYPSQYGIKNIAISNGNECGNLQNFNAGDDLIKYQGGRKLSFLQDIISGLVLPQLGFTAGVLIDPNFFNVGLLSLLPGNSRFDANLQDRSLYPTGGNQIHNFSASYTKKILWLFPVTTYIINKQLYQPSSINKHFDNYGGCFIDIAGYTGGTVMANGLYMRDKFGFVPTPSALGVEAITDANYKIPYIGAQPPVAPLNSPFANFTTAFKSVTDPNKNNEKHLEFNARNGNWLAAELNNASENTNCSFLCSGGQITGANFLCSPSVYTAPNGASFYNWQVISGTSLVTLSNNNTQSITITPVAGGNGSVTIRVFLSGISTTATNNPQSCGYLDVTIWVGSPSVDIALTTNPNSGFVSVNLIGANDTDIYNQGITSIVWEQLTSENGGYFSGVPNSYSAHGFGPNSEWSCEARVTVTNSCGSSTFDFSVIGTPPPPCDTTYQLSAISKNDYEANMIIDPCVRNTFKTVNNVSDKDISSAKLYDIYGTEIRKYNTNNFYFNDVKKGIYILKVQVKEVMLTKKIIVN